MNNTIRKDRVKVSPAQKLEYAKLMIEDNYSNQQDMELFGASSSTVVRWRKQYLTEKSSDIPVAGKVALALQMRRIQELERALCGAKKDNEILKKATGFFIRDNPALE